MNVLKNISTKKKIKNVPSSKNSPVKKIKMKKKDSISILSMNQESLSNSINSSPDNKKLFDEQMPNKQAIINQQDKVQSKQFNVESKSTDIDIYNSYINSKKNVQQNLSERKISPQIRQKHQEHIKNQSPINILHTSPIGKKSIDYQQIIQNSVSKREYNPQNYNYPQPINQEVKEKMQQSTLNCFQNSQKKEQQKNQFYYDQSSPSKSGKSAQKLSINDLQAEQQNSSQKQDTQQNQKRVIAQQNSIESSSNYYYFTESVPADLKSSVNPVKNEDNTPQNYLIKSVDTAVTSCHNSIKKYQISTSNTQKRSASTHRIIGRDQNSGQNLLKQFSTQKERSATIHHVGEEIGMMIEGITVDEVQEKQQGIMSTDSKTEALLKVRRGRSVIKTINPYKSAEKLSSQLKKSIDNKNNNFKTGVNSYRCTSEPREGMHESQQSTKAIKQDEGYNKINNCDQQMQKSETARQTSTITVPDYQQSSILNKQIDLQEQEENKSELINLQKQLSSKVSNSNTQQDQTVSQKKQSILSFGINNSKENDNILNNKDNIQDLRSDNKVRDTYQNRWFEQINQNSNQKQDIFNNNNNQIYGNSNYNIQQTQLDNNFQFNEIQKNYQQSQNVYYSSYPYIQKNTSDNISYQSALLQQQNQEQRKVTELTELVELLEDEQLDEQTWKKQSARKGSAAIIHYTPSKRNITHQSHKTAHCSFIDDNETVKTEFMGPINQSQLLFQDENEHEVSQITPRHLNNFKSRNSFLSSDIMSDFNLRRSNQQLQIQIKNIQLGSNQNLPSSSRQQSQRIQLQSPLKQQQNDIKQQILLSQNLDSKIQQHQHLTNNLYDNNRGLQNNNSFINSQGQYQGYDYNPQNNFQRQNSKEIYQINYNQQINENQLNQLSYRPMGYFRKPPTHRQYRSKGGQVDDILTNGITQTNSQNDIQNMNKIQINESSRNQPQQLLSQQILEQQQQLKNNLIQKQQQLQILERKQCISDQMLDNQNLKQEYEQQQLISDTLYSQKITQNNYSNQQNYNHIRQNQNPNIKQNMMNYIRNKEDEDNNEERILDLLLLDTHELKDKLRESSRNKFKNEQMNQNNYKDIVKSLPIPPELPLNKNIFSEYNQKIFSYENNIV